MDAFNDIMGFQKSLLYLFFTLSLLLLVKDACALGMGFDINVNEIINGKLNSFNMTPGSFQEFSIVWYNTGSVGCYSQMRVDFYKESDVYVYTAWSSAYPLWPGNQIKLDARSSLPAGNYTIKLMVYHCNEILGSGEYNITVFPEAPKKDVIDIIDVKTYDNFVDVLVKSNEDIENVAVIPTSYPLGWIFGSAWIERISATETKNVRIFFEPSIWKESEILLKMVTKDGKYSTQKSFVLKKENQLILLIILLSSIAILIVIIALDLYCKKIKLFYGKS